MEEMTRGALPQPAIERAFTPSGAAPVRDFLRRLWHIRLAGVGLIIVGIVVLTALFAPLLAPYDPTQKNTRNLLKAPTFQHPLGTDELGRDTLSRVIYGARISLEVGVIAVGISLVIGVLLGLVAGYTGGATDAIIMRIMDGLLAFPALVLALAITAMLGPSLNNVMLAIGITGIPSFARLVRGQVLTTKRLEYVQAAQSVGASDWRLMLRHILPNILAPIIVQASISVAAAILAEAGLSFLGLGIQPPTASWGSMLNVAKGYLGRTAWLAIAPGTAIFITVLGFNFLGDAIRDVLDPRLRSLS
ncbi:MAG: ABC transporter permease [Thermomicrobia bacterium]|nr:ABC transporter permease [Thermomicrobia bacterium]